jgi:hypothetical protein
MSSDPVIKRLAGNPEDFTFQEAANLPLPIKGYVALNLLVWVFCLAMLPFIRWWAGPPRDTSWALTGIGFLLVLIPVFFTIASILDAIYDRLGPDERIDEPEDDASLNS